MNGYNFDDFLIVEDDVDNLEIMRSIVESRNQENAFYVLDVARVVKKHLNWIKRMPRVVPYYGAYNFFL